MGSKVAKVIICGLGRMGHNHVRVLETLPGCRIAAIVDASVKKSKAEAERLDCPLFTSLREAIVRVRPDGVLIAAPTAHHYELAVIALSQKIPVFVEKPIAATPEQGAKLIALAQKNKTVFGVGHVERFNPVVITAYHLLQKKALGEIVHINVKRVGGTPRDIRGAGDVLVDLAVHDVDILNWLLKTQTKLISCLGHHRSGVLDSANLSLQADATSISLYVNWITPVKIREIEFYGTKGVLRMNLIEQKMELLKANRLLRESDSRSKLDFNEYLASFSGAEITNFVIEKREPLKEELKTFIHCLQTGTPFPMAPEAALNALWVVDEARRILNRSGRSRRTG